MGNTNSSSSSQRRGVARRHSFSATTPAKAPKEQKDNAFDFSFIALRSSNKTASTARSSQRSSQRSSNRSSQRSSQLRRTSGKATTPGVPAGPPPLVVMTDAPMAADSLSSSFGASENSMDPDVSVTPLTEPPKHTMSYDLARRPRRASYDEAAEEEERPEASERSGSSRRSGRSRSGRRSSSRRSRSRSVASGRGRRNSSTKRQPAPAHQNEEDKIMSDLSSNEDFLNALLKVDPQQRVKMLERGFKAMRPVETAAPVCKEERRRSHSSSSRRRRHRLF